MQAILLFLSINDTKCQLRPCAVCFGIICIFGDYFAAELSRFASGCSTMSLLSAVAVSGPCFESPELFAEHVFIVYVRQVINPVFGGLVYSSSLQGMHTLQRVVLFVFFMYLQLAILCQICYIINIGS